MWEDPIVAEVRKVREQLAAQFAFDAKLMFDDIRKRQAELGNRLISRQRSGKAAVTSPPNAIDSHSCMTGEK